VTSVLTLWTWMIRKPRSLDTVAIAAEAKLASARLRFLAGLTWFALVIGGAWVGAIVGDLAVTPMPHTFLAVSTGLLVFCITFFSGLALGAIFWTLLMRQFGVPESLIAIVMVKGPLWA
jgi:dipeptide/tripeptide permease